MARYTVWYTDPEGAKLALLEPIALSYALVYGDVGWLSVELEKNEAAAYWPAAPDNQVHVYRTPYGGSAELEGIFFARVWSRNTTRQGLSRLTLSAASPVELLARRIVAYYTGSAEAQMTAEADDMMKQIVTDQFIDGTDYGGAESGRDISGLGLSVAQKTADGPSLEKSFSWRNVLSVLQGLQAASKGEGTEVFFDVTATADQTFTFETYTGQPGNDRTLASGSDPLVFAPEWGNLENPRFDEDHAEEANFIYAGGQGQNEQRNIKEASDSGRIAASPWNRREKFRQATHGASTDNAVRDQARDELARSRPQRIFSATILATAETPYGHSGGGWRVGDKVTCTYLGRQFDCLIRSATVRWDGGHEEIQARVEGV